ncbi:hypothetical protein FPZ12_027090 [Amycolatopsis acidicola]|uniref:Uncharacterized protein n=1 Tax=Amycolatopsis acidicola TaxID=2596893 RepID=A0A5N0UZG5_9PSEU|nr:hypothetical protein FPZ12_027090 [Amycolatopsis acidicola]
MLLLSPARLLRRFWLLCAARLLPRIRLMRGGFLTRPRARLPAPRPLAVPRPPAAPRPPAEPRLVAELRPPAPRPPAAPQPPGARQSPRPAPRPVAGRGSVPSADAPPTARWAGRPRRRGVRFRALELLGRIRSRPSVRTESDSHPCKA